MTIPAAANRTELERDLGPFAEAAHELREYFRCPIPLGGKDGKKPLVKWRHRKNPPSPGYIDDLISKFPDVNVGILCGPSCVTVIDIDDPGVASDPQRLEEYKQHFGDTPLSIRTPSDGVHLYYLTAGERNANLRAHGLPVDVRGIGGMVVVPPSVRPSGDHAGQAYGFLAGSWMDLQRLPPLKHGSLSFGSVEQRGNFRDGCAGRLHVRVTKGNRNRHLFDYLRHEVWHCDDRDALSDVARTRNMDYYPPMDDSEVEKIVQSVWGYFERNQLWTKDSPPRVVLIGGTDGDLTILYQNPNALALYCKLEEAHGARKKPFAVSPKAMFEANVIPGFRSERRYRNARQWLIDQELLILVHKGGRGTGDPSSFRFPSKKGAIFTPNITNTPPP